MKIIGRSVVWLFIFLISVYPESALAQKWIKSKVPQEIENASFEAEKYFIEGEKYFILEEYEKALGLFGKALEIEPQNPAIHYKLAETHLRTGSIEKALPEAMKAVQYGDKNKYYHLLMAQIYTQMHKFDDAIAAYETMIKKVEGSDEYFFQLAGLYAMQKEYDKALNAYNRLEEIYGIMDQINLSKQRIYLKQNNVEAAIAEGRKLVEAYPDEPEYALALVDVLNSNGFESEAAEMLEGVVDKDPHNFRVQMRMAEFYHKNKKEGKAREYLIKAFENPDMDVNLKVQALLSKIKEMESEDSRDYIKELADILVKVHPESGIVYAVYGDLLYQLQEMAGAKEAYVKAIEYGENNYVVWQNILQIGMTLGQWDEVISYADEALELYPNQATLYYFTGTAHLIKKNYHDAITVFEQAKKYTFDNAELSSVINGQLGDAYNGIKNYEKADQAYDAALEADPDNEHALNNYSYYLSLRKEKLDIAKKMSTKLIRRFPNNPNYLDTHAWVLYMLGEYDQAKKIMEEALKGDVSGAIIEHYGDILYKLGDVDGALKQWQRAKGMDESSEWIDKKIADKRLYE